MLAKRINVCIENINNTRDRFLKWATEKNWEKEEAKETGILVQLKCQSAPPIEAHFMRTSGRDSELLESVPYEFIGINCGYSSAIWHITNGYVL